MLDFLTGEYISYESNDECSCYGDCDGGCQGDCGYGCTGSNNY